MIRIGDVYTTCCQLESILLQKYRDRNGRCITILFENTGVRVDVTLLSFVRCANTQPFLCNELGPFQATSDNFRQFDPPPAANPHPALIASGARVRPSPKPGGKSPPRDDVHPAPCSGSNLGTPRGAQCQYWAINIL